MILNLAVKIVSLKVLSTHFNILNGKKYAFNNMSKSSKSGASLWLVPTYEDSLLLSD